MKKFEPLLPKKVIQFQNYSEIHLTQGKVSYLIKFKNGKTYFYHNLHEIIVVHGELQDPVGYLNQTLFYEWMSKQFTLMEEPVVKVTDLGVIDNSDLAKKPASVFSLPEKEKPHVLAAREVVEAKASKDLKKLLKEIDMVCKNMAIPAGRGRNKPAELTVGTFAWLKDILRNYS